jgi:hypothetical protein
MFINRSTFKNKDRYIIFIAIVVNLLFLFFFFDYFNLNVTIYGSSILYLGMNAYGPGSQFVAAYFILPYNLLIFALYYVTNFSLTLTFISLKIVGIVILYATGVLLYRTIGNKSDYSKALVVSTIFLNPFLIFDNDVSVSTIFIPMFLMLLSYHFIFQRGDHENISFMMGSLSLMVAGLTYYFPLIIFPTLLLYVSSNKNKLKLLIIFILTASLFYSPILLFHLSSTFSGTLVGGSAYLYPYSALNLLQSSEQLYILSHQYIITIIIVILAFLIPALSKRLNLSASFAIVLIIIVSLLIQPSGIYSDSVFVVFPFIVLILTRSSKAKMSYFNSLIPELFVIPLLIVSQMLNGPGYVTGIFYNLYTTLHYNIVIYDFIPNAQLVWKLLLVLAIIMSIISIYIIIQHDIPRNREDEDLFVGSRHTRKGSRLNVVISFLLVSAVLFVVIIPFSFSGALANNNTITSDHVFPSMLFLPSSDNNIYLMPSPSTYEYNKASVSFNSDSPLVYMTRSLTDQNMNLNFSIGGYSNMLVPSTSTYPILYFNSVFTNLSDQVNITNKTQELNPIQVQNAKTITESEGIIFNNSDLHGEINAYDLNGNSSVLYNLSSLMHEKSSLLFSVELNKYSASQNTIWRLYNGNNVVQLFIVNKNLYFSDYGNNGQSGLSDFTKISPLNFMLNKWYIGGISFAKNGTELSMFFDGMSFQTGFHAFNKDKISVIFGKYGTSEVYNNNFSFDGVLSNVLFTNSLANISRCSIVLTNLVNHSRLALPFSPNIIASLMSDGNTSTIEINNTTLKYQSNDYQVSFGKLSNSSIQLLYTFKFIRIVADSVVPNYLFIVISSSIIAPALFVSLFIMSRKNRYQ